MAVSPQQVVIHRAGGYDTLRLEPIEPPVPQPGEVVIAVRAAGVNYADVVVRMGLYSSAKKYVGWPITPGFEVAGVVTAVGDGVDDLTVGSEVFAVTRFGGYTTHLAVPRHQVWGLPPGCSFVEAASLPAVFGTAWFALHFLAHPRPGDRVLIHSAAGGVGGTLVQLARLAGCEVVGVVGASHKVDAARSLGCHHVIDKSTEALWPRAEALSERGYDLILDANGVSTLAESYRHLRPAGKLVVYGFASMLPKEGGRPRWLKLAWDWLRTPRFNPLELTTHSRSVLAFNLSYLFDRTELMAEAMAWMAELLAAGQLRPLATTTFPLSDVAGAHRALESGQTVGKLVLVPTP